MGVLILCSIQGFNDHTAKAGGVPNGTSAYCKNNLTEQEKTTVGVDDGWFKQPHLAQSDWTLGLAKAARLLHIE